MFLSSSTSIFAQVTLGSNTDYSSLNSAISQGVVTLNGNIITQDIIIDGELSIDILGGAGMDNFLTFQGVTITGEEGSLRIISSFILFENSLLKGLEEISVESETRFFFDNTTIESVETINVLQNSFFDPSEG